MNAITKRINSILLATVIACACAQASENQAPIVVSEQQDANTQDSIIWYKKRSTHVVAALAATAVGIYALAVRKNKIAGPIALLTALFCANKKAQEVKQSNDTKDADKEQNQNNNFDLVTSEDQKIVTQEPVQVDLDQQKTENNQPATSDDVKANDLPTIAAPLHIQAQQYAENALGSIKKWFTAGLIAEDSSQN